MNTFSKKILAILWVAIIAMIGFCGNVVAQEPAQEVLPQQIETLSTGSTESLTDHSRATKFTAQDGQLSFTFPENVAGIYLEWEKVPTSSSILYGKQSKTMPQFLHQYLSIDTPSNQIQLEWTGQGSLCDVYFFTEGPLPDWVQVWQPSCEKADFLLFPTHADDEHLWFGGVMPFYAGEKDLAVQVAYMVQHQNEPYRWHEQLDGLWMVGVEHYPIIPQFPDAYCETLEQAKQIYNQQEIIAYQVEQIRRFKPNVIVGQDVHGEYGHGAHQLNTDSLMQAVVMAADASQFPESLSLGTWDTPKTYLHLYPENQIVMDWNQPLERFGGKTAFEMAQMGYACHTSQQGYWFAVKQSGSYDCRKFGLWRSTVGQDTEPDMLQNLPTPTPVPTATPTPTPSPTATPNTAVDSSSIQESSTPSKKNGVVIIIGLAIGIAIVLILKNTIKKGREES